MIHQFPNPIVQLNAFDVLRDVVEPAEQAKWIPQRRPGCLSETRRDSQPCLFPQLDHDPIFNLLNADCQRGLPTRHGAHSCCNLHRDFVLVAHRLRTHIPAVEFRHEGLRNIARCYVPVENSSVHEFDYNPLHQRRLQVVASISHSVIRNESILV